MLEKYSASSIIFSFIFDGDGCFSMKLYTLFYCLLLFVSISTAKVFIDRYSKFHDYPEDSFGLQDKPLFVTPFLNNKTEVKIIQSMASVNHSEFKGIPSFSGFFTVNETTNSNMFFWYFPAAVESDSAPVILWLQGGPGASSLFGLFVENGPFEVTQSQKVETRKYSWHQTHNMIYIDNPVGAGFSFVEKDEGYSRNEVDVSINLFIALQQFFTLFPRLLKNDFFITGESYAGKYVPALAYTIHRHNEALDAQLMINLKGLAIGNGLVDPFHQLKYGNYLYQLGLIDSNERKSFFKYEKQARDCIKKLDFGCALKAFDAVLDKYVEITGLNDYYNYLRQDGDDSDAPMNEFLKRVDIRNAIHVGNLTFDGVNMKAYDYLRFDMMNTIAPLLSELLSHYRVCIYNGQLDVIAAYPLTVSYLKQLPFEHAKQYENATRHIWKVGKEIAGYVHEAGNLLEILVRNSGHIVPRDQPEWAFDLITRFTRHKSFY